MSQQQENSQEPLSVRDKILIGGLGALTPIIMNLLMVDLEKLFINLTLVSVIAYIIKVAILFYIGGIVAYLNKDENKPIKLFQLGIYAPAMILAFMNTNPLQSSSTPLQMIPSTVIERPAAKQLQLQQKADKDDKDETNKETSLRLIRTFNVLSTTSMIDASAASRTDKSTARGLKKSATEANDTMPERLYKLLIEDMKSNTTKPLLSAIVDRQNPMIDTLNRKVEKHRKEIEKTRLADKSFRHFAYPKETVGEQFLRGFFGWESDRRWFVIVGKFQKRSDAVLYAKLITKEVKQKKLGKYMTIDGKTVYPTIFKPYGEILPEYCVVLGENLLYKDAKEVLDKSSKKLKSVQKNDAELWKLP